MSVKWTKRSRFALEEATRLGYVANRDGSITKPDGSPQKFYACDYYRFDVTLVFEGKKMRTYIRVHRLVAYQKRGDKLFEDGMVVRHIDENPLNNSWDNIEVDTYFMNEMDKSADKRAKGVARAVAKSVTLTRKFTDVEEDDILQRNEAGETQAAIATEFNVSPSTIRYAIRRARIRRGDDGVSICVQSDTARSRTLRKFTDAKEAFILRWFEDENRSASCASMAKSLGVSISTVCRIVQRARHRRDVGR